MTTLLQKMDHLVYAIRLDRIIFMKMQPRAFRWTPLLVIAALAVGYVLMAMVPNVLVPGFWIGWLSFYGAIIAAHMFRVFGPRFTATVHHPLDERELMVKARAHAMSGVTMTIAAMLGCFYMTTAGLPWFWHPNPPIDWINLGFGVQGISVLLPTWFASWLQPPPVVDGED
ncbi:hypothetical protein [Niveispirillum sp. KHB5.9]|uniref:hypothetical protein n=1 Tax=Niveispirillum sp. KHB5.9 TaxID=3400269 RepID=UPI003A8926F4